MRWLLIGLLISVLALLVAAGAITRHVLRLRRIPVQDPPDPTASTPEPPKSEVPKQVEVPKQEELKEE